MSNKKFKGAFSLLEVLIAIVLVGLAVASLVIANGSFTKANASGTNLSTAEFLLEQVREMTVLLPVVDPVTGYDTFGPEADETALADYDDLDDLDTLSLSPPINADRTLLNDFAAYTQQITVQNVSAGNFEQVVGSHTGFVRVTVKVFLNSSQVISADWVRAVYEDL